MKIINLKREVSLTSLDGKTTKIKENTDYVVSDGLLSKIISFGYASNVFYSKDFDEYFKDKLLPPGADLSGKSLLTFRNGGIGDLLFQLPSLKYLKNKYPTSKIFVCCNFRYKDLFTALDYIDGLEELPLTVEFLNKFDYYMNFENLIENNKEAETKNAYDLHAEKFHISSILPPPELGVLPEIEKEVKNFLLPYKDKTKIVISYAASVLARSVNPELYIELIHHLSNRKDIIFFISGSKPQQSGIESLTKRIPRKMVKDLPLEYAENIAYTMALIKNSNCVIGPDSGLLHIAGGFGTPLIGLFGAFPSSLRLKYYKKAKGLNGIMNCFFARGDWKCCFQHHFENSEGKCFLAEKRDEKYSPCMNYIKLKNILISLQELKII